jgi:pimeloyl-ACP methyl ester carboxylesterase
MALGSAGGDQEDRGLSNVLSEEGARGFLEFCPQSEYVNVTGAAHMVAGDRNDIFLNAVIDFLSRASPTATHSPRRTREDS